VATPISPLSINRTCREVSQQCRLRQVTQCRSLFPQRASESTLPGDLAAASYLSGTRITALPDILTVGGKVEAPARPAHKGIRPQSAPPRSAFEGIGSPNAFCAIGGACMAWFSWLVLTAMSSTAVGIVVRHFTKTAITHAFQVRLENVKFEHTKEIQTFSEEAKINLERMKGEMELRAERERALSVQVADARATAYPRLVMLLRKMKRQFEGLAFATDEKRGGAINLSEKSQRAELARKTLAELDQLEKEFEDTLSLVRLFTSRSDYALQSLVRSFVDEWADKDGMFSVTPNLLRRVVDDYNDDIAYLSGEFYRPQISSEQSGDTLAFISHPTPEA
jgi:hypothetical protein